MNVDKDTNDMLDVQASLLEMVNGMIDSGVNSMVIAAMMSNIALQMYKTALSDEDYNAMVDYISANRGRITSFNQAITGNMH